MLQQLLDKIAVGLLFLFSSESVRPLIEQAARPPNSEDVNETGDGCFVGVDSSDTVSSSGLEHTITDYGSISIQDPDQQPTRLLSSCKTSLFTSFTITAAVIPVSLVMISVLYLDVNTSSICYQQLVNNKSLPKDVMKFVIAGDDIESFALNFWFQFMLILLFGWKKFKSHYLSTLLLGCILGLTVVVIQNNFV